MSENRNAGKGDSPRNNWSQNFRDGWEIAFGKKKKKPSKKKKDNGQN